MPQNKTRDQILREYQESVFNTGVAPTAESVAGYTPLSTYDNTGRYPTAFAGADLEDLYGRGQTVFSQLKNGLIKGIVTAGTTALEGTVGLVNGTVKAIADQKMSSFYDNDFNRSLDAINDHFHNSRPNYYTNRERDAKWYSTDTWLTGNFWGETIIKNAGFSVGAFIGGGVWSKALSGTVRALAGGAVRGAGGRMATAAAELEAAQLLGRTPRDIASLQSTLLKAGKRYNAQVAGVNIGSTMSRGFISSFSEAGIEARHSQKEFEESLSQKYWETNGRMPEGADLLEIQDAAGKLGKATLFTNVGLLTLTNTVQLKALRGHFWKSAKHTKKGVERGLGRVNIVNAQGKVVERNATRTLREGEKYVASNATTAVGGQLERFGVGRLLNKVSPYGRIIFSPSEGLEEFAQEVIPNAYEKYFESGIGGEDTDFLKSWKEAIYETFNSKEGKLAIMAGLITGGLMENIASPAMGGRFLHNVRKRNEIVSNTNKFVQELNENTLGNYMQEMNESIKRSAVLAEEGEQAVTNNDRLEFEDNRTDQALNYLLPRVQYGREDLILEDINSMMEQASTEESFAEMKSAGLVEEHVDREGFLNQMQKLKSTTHKLTTQFEALNNRYAGVVNEQGERVYSNRHLGKMAYIASKIDDYNGRMPTLYPKFSKYGIDVVSVLSETDPVTTQEGIIDIITQIEDNVSNPEEREDMLTELDDLFEMRARREQAIETYELMRDNPQLYAFSDNILQEEEDPLDSVPTPEGMTEEEAQGFKDLSTKIFQGEELTPEEQGLAEENQDLIDQYLKALGEKIPTNNKQAFVMDNEDVVFRVGEQEGTITYEDGKIMFNGQEVTAEDFQEGYITSDNISDTTGYLTSEDVRTPEVAQQRLITRVKELLTRSKARQGEINKELEASQTRLKNLEKASENRYTETSLRRLQALSQLQRETQERIQELEQENQELTRLQEEYQAILDDPSSSVSTAISLLEEQKSLLEDYRLEGATLIERLQKVLNDTGDLLRSLSTQVIDNLNRFILGNGASPTTSALNSALNIGDTEAVIELLPRIEGLNIRYAVGREREVIRRITDLQQAIDEIVRAKSEVIEQLQEVNDRTVDRVKRAEEVTPEQEQEFDRSSRRDPTNPIAPEDVLPQETLQELEDETEDITTEEIPDGIEDPEKVVEDINKRKVGKITYGATEKKHSSVVFRSNAMPVSREYRNTFKPYKRWANYLSTRLALPRAERNRHRMMFITANNQQAVFGQDILSEYYQDNEGNPYFSSKEQALNENDGAILIVAVKQNEDGSLSYLDENGQELGKVGKKVNVNKLVAWQMPSTSTTYRNSDDVVAYGEGLEQYQQEYIDQRKNILSRQSAVPMIARFQVSKGSATRGSQSNDPTNIVGNIIAQEDIKDNIILEVVSESEKNIGDLSFSKGEVVVATGEVTERAKTRRLATSEIDKLFGTLVRMSRNPSERESLLTFLQGWVRVGGNILEMGDNFLFVKVAGVEYELTPEYLTIHQEKLKQGLRGIHTNVNRKFLTDNKPFQEIIGFTKDREPLYRDWNSYQEFLLTPEVEGVHRVPSISVNIQKNSSGKVEFVDKYAIIHQEDMSQTEVGSQATQEEAQQSVKADLESTGLFEVVGETVVPLEETETTPQESTEEDAEIAALEGTTTSSDNVGQTPTNKKKTIKDIGKENINIHITTGAGAGHISVNPSSEAIDLGVKVGRNKFDDARYIELPNGNIGFVSTFNHLDSRGGSHIIIEISNNKLESINGEEIQSLMDKIKEDVTAQVDKSLHGEEKIDKVRSVVNKTISDFINNSLIERESTDQTVEETVLSEEENQQPELEETTVDEALARRQEGQYTKDGITYFRNKAEIVETGKEVEVVFADKVSQKARYALIESSEIKPSHMGGIRNPEYFLVEAQPKSRGGQDSVGQADEISRNPKIDQLTQSPTAYSGAPIVNEYGEVIQGNNRAAGVKGHYLLGLSKYKEDLAEIAEELGLNREQVSSMTSPVLVRLVNVEDSQAILLGNFEATDIESGGKQRINPNTVIKRLPNKVQVRLLQLVSSGEGTMNSQIRNEQKNILTLISKYLSPTQINTMTDADGALNPLGIEDIQNLVNQILFQGGTVDLKDQFETLPNVINKGIQRSLGLIIDLPNSNKILPEVQQAISAIYEWRISATSVPFSTWISQQDMFKEGSKTPAESFGNSVISIASSLVNAKKQTDILNLFREYSDLSKGVENLYESIQPMSKQEALDKVFDTTTYKSKKGNRPNIKCNN